jgi:V/A-type H+-transporting ATPase subunit I
MAIALMQKVQLYVHLSKLNELLKVLQRKEIIEITDIEEDISVQIPENRLSSRDYIEILLFLQELFPTEKGFIENFIPQKNLVKPADFRKIIERQGEVENTLFELKRLRSEWQELKREQNRLTTEIEKYEVYKYFPVGLKIAGIKKVKYIAGVIAQNDYLKLQDGLLKEEKSADIHEQVHAQDEKFFYVSYWFLPEKAVDLVQFLTTRGLKEVALPEGKIVYRDVLSGLKKELGALSDNVTILNEKLHTIYSQQKLSLAVIADHLHNEEKVGSWGDSLVETNKVALINGWVIEKRYKELETIVGKFNKYTHLLRVEPSAEETPPVLLQNKLNSPFESVTMVYGLPNSNEFDPTPFLSIFFVIFYGLCLSDFGYGLMLLALSIFLSIKYKKQLTGFGKKLLTVNGYCGVSTMVVGVLTGSYFGLDLTSLPFPKVGEYLLSLRLNDPIANPLPMLYLSVILGVAQIYTGLWVRYFIDIKQKGYKDAFLASGIWVYFISGLILWPLNLIVWKMEILTTIAKFIVYSGVLTLVLTQGRHQKHPLMKLGSGILSLYRLTGLAGDILSYTRLFALGLVTAVLASVINLLAGMSGGYRYWVGR